MNRYKIEIDNNGKNIIDFVVGDIIYNKKITTELETFTIKMVIDNIDETNTFFSAYILQGDLPAIELDNMVWVRIGNIYDSKRQRYMEIDGKDDPCFNIFSNIGFKIKKVVVDTFVYPTNVNNGYDFLLRYNMKNNKTDIITVTESITFDGIVTITQYTLTSKETRVIETTLRSDVYEVGEKAIVYKLTDDEGQLLHSEEFLITVETSDLLTPKNRIFRFTVSNSIVPAIRITFAPHDPYPDRTVLFKCLETSEVQSITQVATSDVYSVNLTYTTNFSDNPSGSTRTIEAYYDFYEYVLGVIIQNTI